MPAAPAPLKDFPVAWFSTVMGLTGLSLAWQRAESFIHFGFSPAAVLLALSTLWFFALGARYALKIQRHRGEVLGELQHPVKQAFVPTFSISLLLLGAAWLPAAPDFSFCLWLIGATLHLGLTLYMLSSWMHHPRYEIAHLNPAWYIPVVGNIIAPIAGVHHAPAEVSWFLFSLGLFFWPILTAIILYRLIFHPALPERLLPTLFIFIAPPAVGLISWLGLNGAVDAFAHILYSIAGVFTLLLLSQIGRFRRLPFFLSWWAYSFPLAAMTSATFLMAEATGQRGYLWLGMTLLALISLLIAGLVGRTALAVLRREAGIAG